MEDLCGILRFAFTHLPPFISKIYYVYCHITSTVGKTHDFVGITCMSECVGITGTPAILAALRFSSKMVVLAERGHELVMEFFLKFMKTRMDQGQQLD